MSQTAAPPALPANVRVFEMAVAAVASRALWAAAEAGVADHLDGEPRAVAALAGATGTHAEALYRVLRLLASHGVFEEHHGRRFSHTEMSRVLRSDHPARTRAAVRMFGMPAMHQAFGALDRSLGTGGIAWDAAHGAPVFDWLRSRPAEASLFNDAMIGIHGGEQPATADAYPFAGTVIDVGGGSGNMIVSVLKRHPAARGVVFDMPHVVAEAARRLEAEGLQDRGRVVPGSFFDGVPAGGDAYILSHIIHDWDEPKALQILEHCRAAKSPGGKVLIVEMVVPPPNVPHPAKMLDVTMLAITGGQERTEDEYGDLLAKAGLRLTRVIPTMSPVSIVEAE
jgi:O-methyltransferase